jgi:hypothetical protein
LNIYPRSSLIFNNASHTISIAKQNTSRNKEVCGRLRFVVYWF